MPSSYVPLRLKVQEKAFLDSFENYIDVDSSSPDVIRVYPKYYEIQLIFGISTDRARRIIIEEVVYKEPNNFSHSFTCMGNYLLRDKTEEEKQGGKTNYKIRQIVIAEKKALVKKLQKELEELEKEFEELQKEYNTKNYL